MKTFLQHGLEETDTCPKRRRSHILKKTCFPAVVLILYLEVVIIFRVGIGTAPDFLCPFHSFEYEVTE